MTGERKRKNWSRFVFIIAIAAMLVITAGCGGSDNEASVRDNKETNSSSDGANRGSGESEQLSKSLADADAAVQNESSDAKSSAVNMAQAADQASSPTSASGGGGDVLAADQSALNRKLIYRANVNMEVEDYAKTQTALQNIIHLSGGYVLDFADQKSTYELGGTYTIKVPSTGFTPFLAQLEKINHLNYESSMKGTDVTEEYVDLESRLKARQVVESRLIAFMEKATKADDLVRFSTELGEVQLEIERLKGRMRYLDQNVAFSTIELRIYQQLEPSVKVKEEEKPGFLERITDALKDSTNFVYSFLQGLLVVIAGALPVLALLAVIAVPAYLIYRRNRGRYGSGGRSSKGGYGMKVDTAPAGDSASNDINQAEQGSGQPEESNSDTDTK